MVDGQLERREQGAGASHHLDPNRRRWIAGQQRQRLGRGIRVASHRLAPTLVCIVCRPGQDLELIPHISPQVILLCHPLQDWATRANDRYSSGHEGLSCAIRRTVSSGCDNSRTSVGAGHEGFWATDPAIISAVS